MSPGMGLISVVPVLLTESDKSADLYGDLAHFEVAPRKNGNALLLGNDDDGFIDT